MGLDVLIWYTYGTITCYMLFTSNMDALENVARPFLEEGTLDFQVVGVFF